MLLMLVDHTREFFYLGHQVTDPVDLNASSSELFLSRLAAHLCAPVFVALTGVSAWLYGVDREPGAVSCFLVKRGLFLMLLEITLVSFAWTFAVPPAMVSLQVIWAIGVSMLALAALIHLPRAIVLCIGVSIVLGHNLLDPIVVSPDAPGHVVWAILHQRDLLPLADGVNARTSYPVLPWIGTIALGWAAGPWFSRRVTPSSRRKALLTTGVVMLAVFCLMRAINVYGDPSPWIAGSTTSKTVHAFVNLTKYPASADFLLMTLGVGTLLLAAFESGKGRWLAILGGAPLFFYVVHLYALHGLYLVWRWAGGMPDVPSMTWVWAIAGGLALPLWGATGWFARIKRTSGFRPLRYF